MPAPVNGRPRIACRAVSKPIRKYYLQTSPAQPSPAQSSHMFITISGMYFSTLAELSQKKGHKTQKR